MDGGEGVDGGGGCVDVWIGRGGCVGREGRGGCGGSIG